MLNKKKGWAPLSLSFCLLLIFFFIVLFFVINRVQSLSHLITEMYDHPLTVSNTVLRIDNNIIKMHQTMKDVALVKNISEIEDASRLVDLYENEVFDDFQIIKERFLGDNQLHTNALNRFKDWKPIRDEVLNLMQLGERDKAADITKGKGAKHVLKLEESMFILYRFAQDKAKHFHENALGVKSKTIITIYIITFILISLGIVFILFLVRVERRIHWSQKALEKSEEKFHKFFDNAPEYCYMVSPEGIILDINRAALEALGYSKEEVAGKPVMTTIYARSSIDRAKKLFARWKESGILKNEELIITTKKGEEKTILLSVDAVKDSDGNLLHSISVQRDITLRKKAENLLRTHGKEQEQLVYERTEALMKSEKRYRSFVQASNQLVWTTNADGEVVEDIPSWRDFTGQTEEEVKEAGWMNALHPDDHAGVFSIWQKAVDSRSPYEVEYRIRKFDGNYFNFIARGIPIFSKDGNIHEWVGTCTDISSIKKAEDELRESEGSLAEAQRIAHLGNWNWDIEKNKLTWSDEIYRIFGLDPQSFTATYDSFLESVHPEDREFVKESVNTALEKKNKPYSIDHRIKLPDDKIRIVHEQAEVFRDEAGKAVRMVGTVQDITEREQVKVEIQKNYETLSLVNSLLDFSLRDISLDDIFKYTIDQIVAGTSFSFESKGCVFVVEGNPERLVMKAQSGLEKQIINKCGELPVGKCLCGTAALERKVKFVDHLNEKHEITFNGMSDHGHYCVPILFGEKALGVINVYTQKGHLYDIKEEEFLTTVANTIAGIIVRRYSEREKLVLEDKLRQSKQMRMLGQLTSGVAHEVRNPLNSIVAITEALFKDIGDNPEYQPYLEHIRKQVGRLSHLMQELLDFGRPGQKSDQQLLSLSPLIFETVNTWKHSSIYKNYKVKILEPPEIKEWNIKADKNNIQQILFNLIDNACAHSPEDKDIAISVEKGENSSLVMKVSDQGIGIPAKHLPHIFDPFFTTRKKGTGLGLSIVKNIVKLHNGTISANNNEPLPGLTVKIRLPLVLNSNTSS
jgi:PAS domain S-box-containing protein